MRADGNLDWAFKTVEMIGSKPNRGEAIAFQADVISASDCETAVKFAVEIFGRLDILVNNVGIAGAPGTAVEVDIEQWA